MTISDLAGRLAAAGVRRVGLQAPEGLKRKARAIAEDLKKVGFEVILSGEPCYGACDLDLHTRDMADLLVHIGHAPVDQTPGVWYEPWPVDADPGSVLAALPLLSEQRVGLVTTIQHVHLLENVREQLSSAGHTVVIASGSSRTPYPGQVLGCSFDAARNTHATEIVFFGTGVFHPIGIAIATSARVIAVDPITRETREISADRFLRQRFALIERARSAGTIGIIISPKSGQDRTALAKRLVSAHPGAVLVTMREVTPDQMLNLGYDAFVNTACPRLAFDDQVRFPVPVLSPEEFEILCGIRPWESYEVDEIR